MKTCPQRQSARRFVNTGAAMQDDTEQASIPAMMIGSV
jgi:hypothetical protein